MSFNCNLSTATSFAVSMAIESAGDSCGHLLSDALQKEARDNISVIVVDFLAAESFPREQINGGT
jgi:hypothetical protein